MLSKLIVAGCALLALTTPITGAMAEAESHHQLRSHRHHRASNPVEKLSQLVQKLEARIEQLEEQVEARTENSEEEPVQAPEEEDAPMSQPEEEESNAAGFDTASQVEAGNGYYRINVHNNCPYTIWAAAFQHNFKGIPANQFPTLPASSTGAEIGRGGWWGFNAPKNWLGGRVWARTSRPASIQVHDYDWTGHLTLAEFGYGSGDNTWYDISRVQGWNVGVKIQPSVGSCPTLTCANQNCPRSEAYLITTDDGAVRACNANQADFTVTFCP